MSHIEENETFLLRLPAQAKKFQLCKASLPNKCLVYNYNETTPPSHCCYPIYKLPMSNLPK